MMPGVCLTKQGFWLQNSVILWGKFFHSSNRLQQSQTLDCSIKAELRNVISAATRPIKTVNNSALMGPCCVNCYSVWETVVKSVPSALGKFQKVILMMSLLRLQACEFVFGCSVPAGSLLLGDKLSTSSHVCYILHHTAWWSLSLWKLLLGLAPGNPELNRYN